MDKKIIQIEEEIKSLHYNPKISKHSFSELETKDFFNTFWDIHIEPVIEYCKRMAEKYNAEKEVVWLGQFFMILPGWMTKSRTMK